MPCNTPSQPPLSPYRRLKALADELGALPDEPLSPIQNAYTDFKLLFLEFMTQDGPDPWKLGWTTLILADTDSPRSMRAAVEQVLALVP